MRPGKAIKGIGVRRVGSPFWGALDDHSPTFAHGGDQLRLQLGIADPGGVVIRIEFEFLAINVDGHGAAGLNRITHIYANFALDLFVGAVSNQ